MKRLWAAAILFFCAAALCFWQGWHTGRTTDLLEQEVRAAVLAKEAIHTGASVRDLILRDGLLTEQELDTILDPYSMTEPGISGEELLTKNPGIL